MSYLKSYSASQGKTSSTKISRRRCVKSKGVHRGAWTDVSPDRISALLLPLRSVMQVTNSAKPMQQVDEVLRRIAIGLNSNARLTPRELLVLCHTLISQNAKFLQETAPKPRPKGKGRKDDAIVQMKRKIVAEQDHYTHNSYRYRYRCSMELIVGLASSCLDSIFLLLRIAVLGSISRITNCWRDSNHS
jgi:hypothetical protein